MKKLLKKCINRVHKLFPSGSILKKYARCQADISYTMRTHMIMFPGIQMASIFPNALHLHSIRFFMPVPIMYRKPAPCFWKKLLKQTVDLSKPIKILDLCAAPGGKSTLIQSIISKESLLVSNEVIKTRVNILAENITKWGAANVIVTNNDPKDFQRLQNYFDVIVVDAPCSGSGLFRKDPNAINEWSEDNVQLCAQRQQRILADIIPSLKEKWHFDLFHLFLFAAGR